MQNFNNNPKHILSQKSLLGQILPTVSFSLTAKGITVNSDRMDTARLIQFDDNNNNSGGLCRQCKMEADMDYLISKDGIYLFCNRIAGGFKFIAFDNVYEIPQYCAFRVRSRKLFKLPYVFSDETIGGGGGASDLTNIAGNGEKAGDKNGQAKRLPTPPPAMEGTEIKGSSSGSKATAEKMDTIKEEAAEDASMTEDKDQEKMVSF